MFQERAVQDSFYESLDKKNETTDVGILVTDTVRQMAEEVIEARRGRGEDFLATLNWWSVLQTQLAQVRAV